MKRTIFLIFLALVVGLVWFGGCRPGGQEIEIRAAPIHEVRISIAESFPPQVFVYIKGGLADGCTTFHDLTIDRSGNTITIKVSIQQPKNTPCAQVYGYFEKNVNLGSQFVAKQTYNLSVNDYKTTFVMP